MENNVLGTQVCPTDFTVAARRHGRHFSRYLLASRYAAGKRVLDAACGGGFGSAWLAKRAASVLGVDLDETMLQTARLSFQLNNLRFQKHDLHAPFDETLRVDLVTSFETLEHVRDPHVCLANLAGCLEMDGVALISIPNGTKELREGDFEPSHLVHYSAIDFEDMTRRKFGQVELFSQVLHRGPVHYFRKTFGLGRHHAHDYRFKPGLDDNAKTWLAVCRQPRR